MEILNLGLKHGLLIRPKESEMVAVIEDVYDTLCEKELFKDHPLSKQRAQTALKSFTYNYLDLKRIQSRPKED